MAPLASIPEANSSIQSTFEFHRPVSRSLFLSHRRGRCRLSGRKLAVKKRFRPAYHGVTDHTMAAKEKHTCIFDKNELSSSSRKIEKTSNGAMSNGQAQIVANLRKSESPFDLDAFPQPPSKNKGAPFDAMHTHNVATQPRKYRPAQRPPLTLAQRKLLVPNQKEPATIGQTVKEAVHKSSRQSVDSVLVAAVSRSIAQQLRLISATSYRSRSPSRPQSATNDGGSSTSGGRRRVLHRFTRDLETYAEQISAKGKIFNDTSTPPTDAATLDTVAELLPYRSQLRAAGLAVTSREQAQGVPFERRDPAPGFSGTKRRNDGHGRRGQLDGYDNSGPSQSTNTEISFAGPQDMDEYRYALIEEAPARKKKNRVGKKRARRRCLPCFPAKDDLTTDTEWTHFKSWSRKPAKVVQTQPRGESMNKIANRNQAVAHSQVTPSSIPQSPRHISYAQGTESAARANPPYQWDRPNFITTGRRHSMTLPKYKQQGEDCYIRHRKRRVRGGQIQNQKNDLPRLDDGKYSTKNAVLWHEASSPSVKPPAEEAKDVRERQRSEKPVDRLVAAETGGGGDLATSIKARTRRVRQRSGLPTRSFRAKDGPVHKYDPYHVGICCPKSRGVPPKLTARPNIPRRTSSIKGSLGSIELEYDDREILDRDVLRGLHVAASAACNEEVDAFVRNKTGLRIRRFLADLMVLETLTAVRPGEDDQQHARRRRAEMRKLKQQIRRSREIALTGGAV
ncbi:uncharacterized protein UV8b_02470 [Ustilaginoidea virens]|uniref:Uncharacterized protein n=1 Tax=Ustilaginoidea virens TaxID=1159556 RepID=A0A8E5HMJ5_USTVR|nr:uncharacterized protein UV8b_02470 [Ustilaginoidea virens]QUC18229.1 hypothetical protein UV8b_02470 [Ustilaginoidea virens]